MRTAPLEVAILVGPKEYTITLPIYYKPSKKKTVLVGLNWFRNVHYRVNNSVKKFYHLLVKESVEDMEPFAGRVEVLYKVYVKRSNTDGGNVGSVVAKYALDGLVEAGMLIDDNVTVVVRETFEYYIDKEFPRVEMIIKEPSL